MPPLEASLRLSPVRKATHIERHFPQGVVRRAYSPSSENQERALSRGLYSFALPHTLYFGHIFTHTPHRGGSYPQIPTPSTPSTICISSSPSLLLPARYKKATQIAPPFSGISILAGSPCLTGSRGTTLTRYLLPKRIRHSSPISSQRPYTNRPFLHTTSRTYTAQPHINRGMYYCAFT